MKRVVLLALIVVLLVAVMTMKTPVIAGRSPLSHALASPAAVVRTSSDVLIGRPTISAQRIDGILCAAASPACGTGSDLYRLGVTSGIDPIYALAFFEHESSFGKYGMAQVTRSLGNIRCSAGYTCLDGYRSYASWKAGYADWYALIRNQYMAGWHLYTVAAIVRVYAPSSENDTQGYIHEIEASVEAWRAGSLTFNGGWARLNGKERGAMQRMQLSRSQLVTFARLFIGRRSDYALQRDNGRYVRVGQPLSYDALVEHLRGSQTLGTYVMNERGLCRFAVFDADQENGLLMLATVQAWLATDGLVSYLEGSRRGGHLWLLLDRLTPASQLRRWLLPYCPAGMEFYPKQDEGGSGYGSLIRVPLGVHRLTGRRYPFVEWKDGRAVPMARSTSALLVWFSTLERVSVPTLPDPLHLLSDHARTGATTHPSLAKKAVAVFPVGNATSIRTWCTSQDAVAVIGRYVQLDYQGIGCCPFGDHHSDGKDKHPSFRVYSPRSASGSCWYCYVWQRGGTLFDFLCYYFNVTPKQLWHRILAGEVF